jgi:hypothetical protein
MPCRAKQKPCDLATTYKCLSTGCYSKKLKKNMKYTHKRKEAVLPGQEQKEEGRAATDTSAGLLRHYRRLLVSK